MADPVFNQGVNSGQIARVQLPQQNLLAAARPRKLLLSPGARRSGAAICNDCTSLTRIEIARSFTRVRPYDSGLIRGATKIQKHEDPPNGRAGVPGKRGKSADVAVLTFP
jgi:hypothetical protein